MVCKQPKPFTDDFWRTDRKGLATGTTCSKCLRAQRTVREEALRAELKAVNHPALRTLPSPSAAKKSKSVARERAVILAARMAVTPTGENFSPAQLSPTKISTAAALKHGADVIVREAKSVLELLSLYARDPESPHHEWALQLFADRILPQRAFAQLAIKEAGLEEKGGAMPRVTLNVFTTGPANPGDGARVIDVEPQPSEGSE